MIAARNAGGDAQEATIAGLTRRHAALRLAALGLAPGVALAAEAPDRDEAIAARRGLADVYALRRTAGASPGAKRNPRVDGLPKGAEIRGQDILLRGPTNSAGLRLAGFDLKGFTLWQDDEFDLFIDDCELAVDPAQPRAPLYTGRNRPIKTARQTITRSTFTLWRNVAVVHSGPLIEVAPFTRIENCRFQRIATGILNFGAPGGVLDISGVYCEAPGQNAFVDPRDTSRNDHCELFQLSAGTTSLRNFFFDGRAYHGPPRSITGAVQVQARAGFTRVKAERGLQLFEKADTWYLWQLDDNTHGIDVQLVNVASRAALRPDGGAGRGGVMTDMAHLSGSGNVDFDSGQLLPGPINKPKGG
jgi:hypothetical protein